jgi:hypothetical protein
VPRHPSLAPARMGIPCLMVVEACQKQAETAAEKPATSRLFNVFLKATLFY